MHLLDQSSVIPLYHQLKQILFGKIQSGEWKPGDKIDSENQLMEMFRVSRNTVKKGNRGISKGREIISDSRERDLCLQA
ncbi:GntR family transcriptional regulator [Lysinibacillus sp. MHQ-1]|nr:GntR family transcriptional regulator [Lysinibacillus sp. MHQ-1]